MNIGIRLHDAQGNDLETRLQSAKKQGFSCAHIAMSKCIEGFVMQDAPKLLNKDLAKETKGLLREYNIQPAVIGCYLNLATPDREEYEHTVEIYKAHLRFAKDIGALVVGTETGAPNTGYKSCPECFTEESLSLFIERLEPIVRYAEEIGAVLAVEPVCRHIMSTPERTERVLKEIHSPNLKVILDAINLLNAENVSRANAVIQESFERFGDQISILHMKDYVLREEDGEPVSLACGLGQMDYSLLLSFAKEHHGLPMTLEDTRPENAEMARLYLEKMEK